MRALELRFFLFMGIDEGHELKKVGNATRLFQNYKRNVLWGISSIFMMMTISEEN